MQRGVPVPNFARAGNSPSSDGIPSGPCSRGSDAALVEQDRERRYDSLLIGCNPLSLEQGLRIRNRLAVNLAKLRAPNKP